jgi:hypothetical protein
MLLLGPMPSSWAQPLWSCPIHSQRPATQSKHASSAKTLLKLVQQATSMIDFSCKILVWVSVFVCIYVRYVFAHRMCKPFLHRIQYLQV